MQEEKRKETSFFQWFTGRIIAICEERVTDIESGKSTPVMTASIPTLMKGREEAAARNRKIEEQTLLITRTAEQHALADNSDPFAFARAKSHMLSGLCSPNDYSVQFIKKKIPFKNADGEEITRTELIPTKMCRP